MMLHNTLKSKNWERKEMNLDIFIFENQNLLKKIMRYFI